MTQSEEPSSTSLRSLCARVLVACLLVLIADQITKEMALSELTSDSPIEVLPGFFNLTLHFNPGVAFGLFASLQPALRSVLLLLTTFLALSCVGYFLLRDFRHDPFGQIALGFILGGAFGNIIDRLRFGHVVDFLDFYVGRYHWPAFNLADSFICIGVGLLILKMMIGNQKGAVE